ncbi:CUE domain-containing protein 2-B-like isoform X2 [Mytilus edulis]|uniref:CUE domain-containing protein 2-B-like isoform X2 n=1 Tax=Mytilus edulis TaxID=6550 RepID=UPI0039EF915F
MATDRESLVKDCMSKFLKKHDLHDSIEAVDEIVLSYVVSILEDLGDDQNAEENIDVDQFTEMIDAYIPGFCNIDSVEVCEWMFSLSTELVKEKGDSTNIPKDNTLEPSDPESIPGDTEDDPELVTMLLEMFPTACSLEISHCLALSNGDPDSAAQLIIHRQEIGDTIVSSNYSKKKKNMVLDDNKVKSHIINRFSYVDTDTDKKTHTPTFQKQESKKLVRYLDNKVVSTKGEKFTEIKKENSEEMKKTYINLKPARKYRFH